MHDTFSMAGITKTITPQPTCILQDEKKKYSHTISIKNFYGYSRIFLWILTYILFKLKFNSRLTILTIDYITKKVLPNSIIF